MHPEMVEIEQINELTQKIIEAAMGVYRTSGPGKQAEDFQDLLRSALSERGLEMKTIDPPTEKVESKLSKDSDRGVVLVEDQVMIEIMTLDPITQDLKERLVSDLKQLGYHVGLLINFDVGSIEEGIKRLVNY